MSSISFDPNKYEEQFFCYYAEAFQKSCSWVYLRILFVGCQEQRKPESLSDLRRYDSNSFTFIFGGSSLLIPFQVLVSPSVLKENGGSDFSFLVHHLQKVKCDIVPFQLSKGTLKINTVFYISLIVIGIVSSNNQFLVVYSDFPDMRKYVVFLVENLKPPSFPGILLTPVPLFNIPKYKDMFLIYAPLHGCMGSKAIQQLTFCQRFSVLTFPI